MQALQEHPENDIYQGTAIIRNILADRWVIEIQDGQFFNYPANFTAENFFSSSNWNIQSHDSNDPAVLLRSIRKGTYDNGTVQEFHQFYK